MLEMWKNWIKILPILCFVFLLSSCDELGKSDVAEVDSGVAQTKELIFSKSCPGGSFKVSKSFIGSTTVSSSGLAQLNVGDQISISGTITNASPCYTGTVNFHCEATVKIDQNRSFVCSSGTVSGVSSAISGTTTSIPSTGAVSTTGTRSFLSGMFHTFGNGTQAYGQIIVGSPIVPNATCHINFTCL